LKKYRSQEVASNKLEKGPLRDYKTVFNSPVAFAVLEKKIFKDLASCRGFSLPVRKIIGNSEPFEQIIKRPTQGTFMPKISFLGIIVSEKKIFKELLARNA
jgi:hypothetical protein